MMEPLRVKLVPQERSYYSGLYDRADANQSGQIEAKDAVAFLSSSGLPMPKLGQIWQIAAHTSNAFLTKEEFYIALRLIAYEQ